MWKKEVVVTVEVEVEVTTYDHDDDKILAYTFVIEGDLIEKVDGKWRVKY